MTKKRILHNTKLSQLRRNKGMTQEDLAQALGLSASYIKAIESKQKTISNKFLKKACAYFDIEATEILDEFKPISNMNKIPIISWVKAGLFSPVYNVKDMLIDDDIEYIEYDGNTEGKFALVVDGDSMNMLAPDSSIIIVDTKEKNLVDGWCYVISDDEYNNTFKKYRANPDRFEPCSTQQYDIIFPSEENNYTIIGSVERVILHLKKSIK